MNIKETLNWAKIELKETSEPESSAMVLLSEVFDMTRTELLANSEKELSKSQLSKFKKFIERRKKHESVWHIIGKVGFWGLEFFVDENVLVPRPETEILVEEVVNYILGRDYQVGGILDIGTGSGTIAVALACEFPEISITATDISEEALKVAKKNAKHNRATSVKFIKSDLFENIKEKFDIICANLPYIPEEDSGEVSFEVHHHEPHIALYGGDGGLAIYERFFKEAGGHLNKGGAIFCEIGINQGKDIRKIIKKYLPKASIDVLGDLAGIDRVVIIRTSNK